MDWTDLQKNWVPLSDPDKYRKYAKENHSDPVVSERKDSYFELDRGSCYDNITEYNFTNIPNIETEIRRITGMTGLQNTELLARITAVTMMKMQPEEVTARERFNAWEKIHKKTQVSLRETVHTDEGSMPGTAATDVRQSSGAADVSPKKDNAPPDFYYPM
jgi:hypothetical protein